MEAGDISMITRAAGRSGDGWRVLFLGKPFGQEKAEGIKFVFECLLTGSWNF